MIVNLIGGSGFIGTRLGSRLSFRDTMTWRNFDKAPSVAFPSVTTIGDVRSVEHLRNFVDFGAVIINLAAEHRDDVIPTRLYQEVNVTGARNICAVAEERGVQRIIFTSTVAVYGFAQLDTDESGEIAPFNEYGRTKFEAEGVFRSWQAKQPDVRSLTIIRPTVVFGERNRGNVYNLLCQIASGRFIMVGNGENRKSMAYVENVAAFIEHALAMPPGVHICNYVDKPDFSMNSLVALTRRMLGRPEKGGLRIPFAAGYIFARGLDLVSVITGKRFAISGIRVRKFCANSVYASRVADFGFTAPVSLHDAIRRTVEYEFAGGHRDEHVFVSE